MSSSPLDGFEKARNKSLRTERNAPVLDAFRDDLSWGGLVDDFYVDLEYVLHKSGKRIHGIDSLAQTFGDKNLLLCAPAGYGKTASFKKIFIQNSTGKQRFHYVSATIFSAKRTILSNYDKSIRKAVEENIKLDGTILIDGIEEAYGTNYKDAGTFLNSLSENENHIWIAGRPAFWNHIERSADGFFDETAEIKNWEEEDFNVFLSQYAEKTYKPEVQERINSLRQHMIIRTSSIYCPLYATILVFLAKSLESNDEDATDFVIRDEYELLEAFVSIWIEREKARYGLQGKNSEESFAELRRIAILLYKKAFPILNPNFTEIEGLLYIPRKYAYPSSRNSIIHRFYHRDFLIYFVVDGMRNAAIHRPEAIIQWYSQTFSDEVTNLYNKALEHDEKNVQQRIFDNLFEAYRMTYESRNAVAEAMNRSGIEATPQDFLEYRDELLYFILRLHKVNCEPFIKYAHAHMAGETMLALGLAYGMAGIRQHPYTLDFARKLCPGEPEDITNRSWAVCFFGDQNDNGFTYRDEHCCPWDKVRKVKLDRLKIREEEAYRYRLLDLPLLYCFYASRGFKDCTSYTDYMVLRNTDVSYARYTTEEMAFLEQQKHQLQAKYEECLMKRVIESHPESIVPMLESNAALEEQDGRLSLSLEARTQILYYVKAEEETENNLKSFWNDKGHYIMSTYPPYIDVPTGFMLKKDKLKEKLSPCEILLITANHVEGSVLSRCLMELNQVEKLERVIEDEVIYQFSSINEKPIVHIWPQGTSSFTEHGSFNALEAAFSRFNPKYVFSVGVAFGADPKNQTLGDVLVADHLVFYDSFNKINDGKITLSPDEVQRIGVEILGGLPILCDPEWPQKKSRKTDFKWHKGPLLTGGSVLSDSVEKLRLMQATENMSYHVVGGEMEGSGLYFACKGGKRSIPFTIVKGICDWAINKNGWSFATNENFSQNQIKELVQAYACHNAFNTLCIILEQISL